MVVGWLCNLIAWIVSFFFSIVKFLFFCSFLASSCATYSCQTSAGPDITARLLGHNVIGWQTTCEHRTVPLNINEVSRNTINCDTQDLIYKTSTHLSLLVLSEMVAVWQILNLASNNSVFRNMWPHCYWLEQQNSRIQILQSSVVCYVQL